MSRRRTRSDPQGTLIYLWNYITSVDYERRIIYKLFFTFLLTYLFTRSITCLWTLLSYGTVWLIHQDRLRSYEGMYRKWDFHYTIGVRRNPTSKSNRLWMGHNLNQLTISRDGVVIEVIDYLIPRRLKH